MVLEVQPDEKLIAQLFRHQPDSVLWLTPVPGLDNSIIDFKVKYCNAAACRMFSPVGDDITGSTILTSSYLSESVRISLFKEYLGVWTNDEPVEFTYYVEEKDTYLNVQRSKVMNGVLSITRDRTAELRAEKQKDEQARLLDHILNNSINGVYTLKAEYDNESNLIDFRISHVNDFFCQISSRKRSELVGKRFSEVFPDSKNTGIFDRNSKVLMTGQTVRQELHYNGDGVDAWYDTSVTRISDDTIAISFNDITSLKNTSKAISDIIDNAQTGICLLAPWQDERGDVADFRILHANRMFCNYAGLPLDEVKKMPLSHFLPEYKIDDSLFHEHLNVFERGGSSRREMYFTRPEGHLFVDISATKLGQHLLVTFHDNTSLKELQLQLEASNAKLKGMNDRLTQFTHVASHDLNEPLRKIKSFITLIQQKYSKTFETGAADYFNRIIKTSDRMQVLISDLLNYSTITSNVSEFAPVSLQEIVQEVVSDLEISIAKHQGSIELGSLPVVNGDATQLRQVFQNLLSNALKFHKPDSRPRVKVSCKAVSGLAAHGGKGESFYRIEVADNGIGFDEADTQAIFGLFNRLHSRNEFEGTGIGLAIVSRGVQNHGGFLEVHSTPGKGSIFHVFLPATLAG